MRGRSDLGGYSAEDAARLAGTTCEALLVWERRYGFPCPSRTAAGPRIYPADQVAILGKIVTTARSGSPIGQLLRDHRSGELAIDGSEPGP